MGPGEDDLHIALRPFHLQQVGFDAIPAPVGLPWYMLVRRQDRLGLSEIDDVVTAFLAENDAVDEVALASRILPLDDFPFSFADFLEAHMLGRLRRDPAELPELHDCV